MEDDCNMNNELKELFEFVNDFDDLTYRIQSAVKLLDMCHTIISEASIAPYYSDGLYAAICYLQLLIKELETTSQVITDIYHTAKKRIQ